MYVAPTQITFDSWIILNSHCLPHWLHPSFLPCNGNSANKLYDRYHTVVRLLGMNYQKFGQLIMLRTFSEACIAERMRACQNEHSANIFEGFEATVALYIDEIFRCLDVEPTVGHLHVGMSKSDSTIMVIRM